MNKEYTYIDGKVIITTDEGKKRPIEYYDNLDEVLEQENLIETMENKIIDLEAKFKEYDQTSFLKFSKIPFFSLAVAIGTPLFSYLFLGNMEVPHNFLSQLSAWQSYSILFLTAYFPLAVAADVDIFKDYKESLRNKVGISNELQFLKKQLVFEREKLATLKTSKKRDKENKEFRVVEVNEKEKLQRLKNWLNICYDLGYNEEKYCRYYEQGKLEEKIKKYYTEAGIEIVKGYVKQVSDIKRK